MTKPTKGLYYYFVRVMLFLSIPLCVGGMAGLYQQYLDSSLTDFIITAKHLFLVAMLLHFWNEVMSYGNGYTQVWTTEYNLFKCRESGKEETFMMFADSEEELEKFFRYMHPNKVVFIEEADMSAKSIRMRIFDQADNEDRQHQ